LSLKPQSRDTEILIFVFKHRAATLCQIRSSFFAGKHKSTLSKRINRLCNEGYLKQGITLRNQKSMLYYMPTKKTFGLIASKLVYSIDAPYFKSESIAHDLCIAEISLRLSKLRCFKDFIPENILQSSSHLASSAVFGDLVRLQTDAGLVVTGSDSKDYVFAIEVETSLKGYQRYIEKLQAYYLIRSIKGLIYICSNQNIANCLVKADAEVRSGRRSLLYISIIDDALTESGKITFRSPDEHIIELE
jgi:hypothetical protein